MFVHPGNIRKRVLIVGIGRQRGGVRATGHRAGQQPVENVERRVGRRV
jgi:hypothetical protein